MGFNSTVSDFTVVTVLCTVLRVENRDRRVKTQRLQDQDSIVATVRLKSHFVISLSSYKQVFGKVVAILAYFSFLYCGVMFSLSSSCRLCFPEGHSLSTWVFANFLSPAGFSAAAEG